MSKKNENPQKLGQINFMKQWVLREDGEGEEKLTLMLLNLHLILIARRSEERELKISLVDTIFGLREIREEWENEMGSVRDIKKAC